MSDVRDSSSRLSTSYVLGHSDQELDRLGAQARLVDPITRRLFRDAGIGPGNRVLDVGSGAGDVAFLAAELVGPAGAVVGIDRSANALAVARTRAAARSLSNISFCCGELSEIVFERPFDAVVGRYVLMFQPDAVVTLRQLAAHVRPGGSIAFHEIDWAGARSFPPCPTYDRCCRWIAEVVRLSGADARMAVKLTSAFVAAGLPEPAMRLEALIGGGATATAPFQLVADLVPILMPEMVRFGVTTPAEAGIETLMERMIDEATRQGSVIVGRSEVGAWTRVSVVAIHTDR